MGDDGACLSRINLCTDGIAAFIAMSNKLLSLKQISLKDKMANFEMSNFIKVINSTKPHH
jgi:hypothetical protein